MKDLRAQYLNDLRRLESEGHEGLRPLIHESRETAEGGIDRYLIVNRAGEVLASG